LIRILQELEDRAPPVVLIENVVGFLMQRQGKDLETALLAFNRLGYSVDAFILNAKRWTPQSRARLFLVATRGVDGEASSCALETDSRPKALVDFMNSHSHIDWRLRALPPLPRSDVRLKDIVEDLPDDDAMWWDSERTSYFMNQLSERHEADAQAMSNTKEWSYATAFRRVRAGKSMAELRTDGIAGCLRTPRGGSGRQILLKAGFGKRQVRLLSARECARLQGVPDSYVINVRLNQALFGFGDAVCVPAIEWIVKNYVTPVSLEIKSRGMPLSVV
jgi:DNA (cytosine-5)-methyltransferase 1